ncbi:Baseplate protein J-like domain-containing protein [Candidatus Magnetomoraceae bacterium gMMP-15]
MSIPVEKTLEEIRSDLFSKISSVQQDGYLPQFLNLNRGPIRGLIELWAWGLHQLYQFLAYIFIQAFPSTATGDWLDLHCEQVEIIRHQSTKVIGNIIFFRDGDTAQNINIPIGRIVRTQTDAAGQIYRFVTTEEKVLQAGDNEVSVTVEAEEYGAASNVAVGQICEISTVIAGVDGVRNEADWLTEEGIDEETDEALRARYILAWSENSGCTKYAYESWALAINGVVDVKILDQHELGQGTVGIIIKGTNGLPTQALLDEVENYIAEKKPINDEIIVAGPGSVFIDIDIELTLIKNTDANTVKTAVENQLYAIFTDPSPIKDCEPIQIGEDITKERFIYEVMRSASGIKTITWNSPFTTDNLIAINSDELAILNSLQITTNVAAEI